MKQGAIHSIETFGTVDGPGIRYVVFFQGCPLRCQYCHNPDSWQINVGTKKTADEIIADYKRQEVFYKNGGITATGGEPLLQLDFLIELFQKAKEAGIHTCLDTSGILFTEKEIGYKELAKVTDYVLLDIKHVNEIAHKQLTGKENQPVFQFLSFLEKEKIPVRIRHVLVPSITMEKEFLMELGRKLALYNNIKEIELLPYHTMGIEKYRALGIPYKLEEIKEPTKEEIKEARRFLLDGFRET